jgi:hypothetical protein
MKEVSRDLYQEVDYPRGVPELWVGGKGKGEVLN